MGKTDEAEQDQPKAIFDRYSLDAARLRAAHQLTPREEVRDRAVVFAALNGVEGDFLDFGTFRGDGIVQAYHTHQRIQQVARINNRLTITDNTRNRGEYQRREASFLSMRFIAFDSFAGFPEPTEDYERMIIEKGDVNCSRAEFEENLRINKVDPNRVEVVEGFFNATLNAETKRRLNLVSAAIVYVDCDLYDSTRLVLDFVSDIVVDGTIIVFDDWYLFKGHPRRGEQRAFKEWLEVHPDIQVSEYIRNGSVNSFIVHK